MGSLRGETAGGRCAGKRVREVDRTPRGGEADGGARELKA